jgi:hypothetical protein
VDDDSRADDVVELGGRRFFPPGWRPSRGAGILAGVALIAGLAVGIAAGYAAGDRHAHDSAAPPKPAGTAAPSASAPAPTPTFSFVNSPALFQDIGACSAQTGRDLQLGVQVTNQSTAPLTLQTIRAVVPMGGLKQVTQYWAPCGALPARITPADDILQPGASTWLTVTLKVQVRCPTPYPVLFAVGYLEHGQPATAQLPGFPDLSQIPYSGCPANTVSTLHAQIITQSQHRSGSG